MSEQHPAAESSEPAISLPPEMNPVDPKDHTIEALIIRKFYDDVRRSATQKLLEMARHTDSDNSNNKPETNE